MYDYKRQNGIFHIITRICIIIMLIIVLIQDYNTMQYHTLYKDYKNVLKSANKINSNWNALTWDKGVGIYFNNNRYVALSSKTGDKKFLLDGYYQDDVDIDTALSMADTNDFRNNLTYFSQTERNIVISSSLAEKKDLENVVTDKGVLNEKFSPIKSKWWTSDKSIIDGISLSGVVSKDNVLSDEVLSWNSHTRINSTKTGCDTFKAYSVKGMQVSNTVNALGKGTWTQNIQHDSENVAVPSISWSPTLTIPAGTKIYSDAWCMGRTHTLQRSMTKAWAYVQNSITKGNVLKANTQCVGMDMAASDYAGLTTDKNTSWMTSTLPVFFLKIPKDVTVTGKGYSSNWYKYSWTEQKTEQCTGITLSQGIAAVRPVITINPDSILFASYANTGIHASTSNLKLFTSRFIYDLDNTLNEGYKLTVKNSNIAVSEVQNISDTANVIQQSGTNFILKPGATTFKIKVSTLTNDTSTPNKIAAYTTGIDGMALYGEVGDINNSTSDVEIDLSNIMDTSKPGSKTIELYAEQENGAYKTDYLSEKYEITLTIPVDQTLGLKKDTVLSGTYGETLTLTAVVNEEEVDRTWDPERELIASIAPGYEEIGEVTSSIWDKETGMTKIEIKPKKSGVLKLKLSKESDPDNGITVNNNDMLSADIKVEKRKVTLQPEKQEHQKNEIFEDYVINDHLTDDETKDGLVNGDKLPDTIKVKTKETKDAAEEYVITRTVNGQVRYDKAGTWIQDIDMSQYDASPVLDEKYTFTTATNDITITEALVPDDTYIDISPACVYEKDDKKCWNDSTVTIKPSQKAIEEGYTRIKDTTKEADEIEKDETGFASEITIVGPARTKLEDIKYNLKKDKDKNILSDQGTVGKQIRIDTTAPATIDVETIEPPAVTMMKAVVAAAVETTGGSTSGIRFDKMPIKLKISAEDMESGIREIKARKVNDDGSEGEEITISQESKDYVENAAVPGPENTTDQDKTYSKKVYSTILDNDFNGRIKITATNNAGLESTKTTNLIVHESEGSAALVLEAGSAAVRDANGDLVIKKDQLAGGTDMKWPLNIQAPKSGIKKISYYITDETDSVPLVGKPDAMIDVTGADGFGIKGLTPDLAWDKAEDNELDIAMHEQAVVSLKDAIEAVKEEGRAVLHIHAKLESNAGNEKEEIFPIQILYQKIAWSDAVKALDTDPATDTIELEATYGTPITLSAELDEQANRWSETGGFTFALEPGDTAFATLRKTTQEALIPNGGGTALEKGKATVELVPLTGNDQEIKVRVKKAGDSEYVDSNELTLSVKLKSKPIDITADPTDTYDVKTGEEHPKLTWKITDSGKEDGGLVKDTEAGIEDTELDFGLKATVCVDGGSCGITDLSSYEQRTNTKEGTRIDETGEWKLEFQYDENKKDDDSPQSVFNKKYAIHFIDHSSGDTTSAQRTLKVTQDAFDETWYTITAPKDLVKADTDAWNTSAVTIQPTDQALTDGTVKRTYSTITNADKITEDKKADPAQWGWDSAFTHTKDEGTSPKTYKLRFRDPATGAFTAEQDAKRSVRVDEDVPSSIDLHTELKDGDSSVLMIAEAIVKAAGGDATGIRFANTVSEITITAKDERSGIREVSAYKLDADGKRGDEIKLTFDPASSKAADTIPGPGSVLDEKTTYAEKVYTATLPVTFDGKIEIIAADNAGNEAKQTTNRIVIEDPKAAGLILDAGKDAPKDGSDLIVRNDHVNGDTVANWPLKIQAKESGVKSITYYITDESGKELAGTKAAPLDITGAGGFGIDVLPNEAAWTNADEAALDTAVHDERVIPLKDAVAKLKGKANAVLQIHAKLESNSGNTIEREFDLHIKNQEITWSQAVLDQDTHADATTVLLEAEYGTPIDISAEMIQASTGWSSTSEFTYSLGKDEEKYANIVAKGTTHSDLKTSGNPTGTAKGKAGITLIPLTGNDQEVTLSVKKGSDAEYIGSNELKLSVKLKSKPIDITADPTDTYDVKTGEEHPKLTWKITDSGKEDGGLVKDTEAGIEDTELDFGLKATVCVDGGSCGITDLSSYEQRTNTKEGTRIDETGEWKLEFQYDENKKDDDSPQSVFNKKYAIHFIDHSSGDTTSAQRTLKVTQDAFDETWYTITAPKDLVKADTDAWNTSAVTIQPTDQAITKDLKERTYTKIIDDGKKDKGDIAHPETWSWADTIVHTKDDGTEPKTYEVRFRDPTSGAFTEAGKVKRSVRVDETAPIQPFIRVNDTAEAVIPDAGLVQGKRFSKDGLRIQAGIVDKESGIRSFNVYKIYSTKEGTKKEEIPKDELKITDVLSKTVPGVSGDGTAMAVEKRTAEFTITEEYKGSIKIVAVNDAGLETTYETGQLINEPQDNDKLTITKDETEAEKIPDTITRDNYLEDYQYPWKLEAPVSGIRTITYTMQIDNDDEKDPKTLKKETAELTKVFKVADAEDKAVEQGTAETTPTYGLDRHAASYGTYFSIKPYIDEMIKEKVELATITIKIELESNAGNKKIETFRLPVDMMLNDPQDYIITPKRVELKRNDEETEAIGKAEVQLKTIEQDTLPAGLDITQYFNIYTPSTITLHNEGSYHKDTFTVSVYDEAGKKLTEDKNVLASLNYVHKETAAFTLKTVLITEPAKDKDRGEYKGVMTYTVKYGKEDKEHQPKEDTP